jgi:hypothetical protein
MASQPPQAINTGDLVDLVSSSASATVYPNDDAILAVLQARFRADMPYTRVGATGLVVVNPFKTLANVNDVSAKDYEERCYKDTSLPLADGPKPLQPHLYDLAARIYLLMRRRNESQSVISRYVHPLLTSPKPRFQLVQRHYRIRQVVEHPAFAQPSPSALCAVQKRTQDSRPNQITLRTLRLVRKRQNAP